MLRPRIWVPAIVAVILFMLFDSRPAYGWGPATHVKLATDLLDLLPLIPSAIGSLLSRFAVDFVFGNVAADVVFAKRLSKVKQFCHHWSTGFELLDEAQDDRARAFAYGYLCHLAADTVAHGKYVPRQVTATNSTMNFGHLYWELRADHMLEPGVWRRLRQVIAIDHDAHHALMARRLTDTFLPFAMNRQLFDRINYLVSRRGMHKTLQVVDLCSRFELSSDLIQQYHSECTDRMLCLLTHGARSPLLREDPNGTAALAYTRATRRQIRVLSRYGYDLTHRVSELLESHAPKAWDSPARPLQRTGGSA
ncbi:MAG TPA: zinc dependent phospholipase C family protein [Phycisphaerae bacterium]|jgi:hypothetical protein